LISQEPGFARRTLPFSQRRVKNRQLKKRLIRRLVATVCYGLVLAYVRGVSLL
jgi:hypothetical protein